MKTGGKLGLCLRAEAATVLVALAAVPAAASHFRYRHFDWANKSRLLIPEFAHTPDAVTGLGPQYLNVGGDVDGTPAVFGKLTFLNSGGITVNGPSGLNYTLNGPVLFGGPANDPTFVGKRGQLFNPTTGRAAGNFYIAAVPEPGSWLLMIGGFGAVGLASRRQRRLASHSWPVQRPHDGWLPRRRQTHRQTHRQTWAAAAAPAAPGMLPTTRCTPNTVWTVAEAGVALQHNTDRPWWANAGQVGEHEHIIKLA